VARAPSHLFSDNVILLWSDHSARTSTARVCYIHSVDELKGWLIQLWCNVDLDVIDTAIGPCKKRNKIEMHIIAICVQFAYIRNK